MVNVFVSYAHQDAKRVEPLVALLEANGCTVWWDRNIAPGSNFEQKIEEALTASSCVIIALTAHAAKSDWVRAEGATGQQHNKLIPVLLDDVQIPLSLRAVQVADLRGWPGGSDAEAQKLLAAVAALSPQGNRQFVGRGDTMRTLQKALDAALEGHGGLVMVSGEPGIGKTRCAQEFAHGVEDRGGLVLWGRCDEQGGAPPYWPWVQILREYADANSDDELRMLIGGNGEVIAPLVPEIGTRLGIVPGDAAQPTGDQRFRLFDTISRIFAKAATDVPLVMILDDVHWADASSLTLLEFLSKDVHRQRCLIVCLYRDVEVGRKSPLLATLGEISRAGRVERLRLSGLDVEQTAELTAAISGIPIPQSVIAAIYHQTDGNPLFVREVALLLADEASTFNGSTIAVQVPDGIREAIGRRLDRLSETCNQLLAAASVVGREFDLKIVAQALHIDVDVGIRELESAVRAGIVRREGTFKSLRFSHAVIRETLYEEIPTLERLQLHQRIAAALVAAFGDNLDPVLSQLAHHYGEASVLGEFDRAVEFAERAAARAERVFALDEAWRHYDDALRVLAANGREEDPRVARIRLYKGRLGVHMSRIADAQDCLTLGIGLARRLGDEGLFADYVTELVHVTSYAPTQHAVPLVQEALRLLPNGDTRRRALLVAELAFALRSTGAVDAVERTGRQAIALADELGEACLRAEVRVRIVMGLRGDATTLPARLELGREMVELAGAIDDQQQVSNCWYWRLLTLIEAGEIEEFSGLLERLRQHSKTYKSARNQYLHDLLRGALCLLRGEWSEAEALIEGAYAQGEKFDAVQQLPGSQAQGAEGTYGAQMFELNRALGRLQVVAPVVRRMIEDGGARMWAPGAMMMCCEVGLLDLARTRLDALAANDFSNIARDDMWTTCMVFCAEACARLRDAKRAEILHALLLPYSDQTANYPNAVCFGSVSTYLGMLAQTMGRLDLARAHFNRAIDKNRAMGAWPQLARTEVRFAQLLLNGETDIERESGKRLIADAEQLAARFDMAGLAAEIGEILKEDVSQLPDGLTAREVDVLKLLAIGRSNKDVSKVLTISLSTVATHVRSILTKTGCTNRTEAAAYAMRHDLS